jgi:hypothetical protein
MKPVCALRAHEIPSPRAGRERRSAAATILRPHYNTLDVIATEKTRIPQCGTVRATRWLSKSIAPECS